MTKLTIEDLKKIKDRVSKANLLRSTDKHFKLIVHMGSCGIAAGAKDILDAIIEEIDQNNVSDVLVSTAGCMGDCSKEPLVTVEEHGKDAVVYGSLDKSKISQIFKRHILGGDIQKEYIVTCSKELAGGK